MHIINTQVLLIYFPWGEKILHSRSGSSVVNLSAYQQIKSIKTGIQCIPKQSTKMSVLLQKVPPVFFFLPG